MPIGADAYTLKNVLHNWDDESCLRILSNCRRVLTPKGRLFAAEIVLDPAASPPLAYLLDLHMLVSLTGRERTSDEFRALFAAAGLELTRVTATRSLFSVLEAVVGPVVIATAQLRARPLVSCAGTALALMHRLDASDRDRATLLD